MNNPSNAPENKNPSLQNINNEEINLLELLSCLWQQKVWIMCIALITTVIAASYAFIAKEEWTAKAYLSKPRISELSNYLAMNQTYARIVSNPINQEAISEELFADLLTYAFSPNEKINFLRESNYFKQETQALSTEQDKHAWLVKKSEKNIKVVQNDKPQKNYNTITMTARTASEAQSLLTNYIQWINKKVVTLNIEEFNYHINNEILSLKNRMNEISLQLKVARENEINKLTESLNVAKEANIKNFVSEKFNTDVRDPLSIPLLGEKYISTTIAQLKNAPISYPYNYYRIEKMLNELTSIVIQPGTTQSYQYLLTPDNPISKDHPKKALIIILGLISGLILGSVIALTKEGYRAKNRVANATNDHH